MDGGALGRGAGSGRLGKGGSRFGRRPLQSALVEDENTEVKEETP